MQRNDFVELTGDVPGNVPCDGCVLCCQKDAVRLLPHENHRLYYVEPHPIVRDTYMLAHKANGDCIYLGETGCTIHDRRPHMCRRMDCRLIVLFYSASQIRLMKQRKHKAHITKILERGKELLKKGTTKKVPFR